MHIIIHNHTVHNTSSYIINISYMYMVPCTKISKNEAKKFFYEIKKHD